MEEKKDNQKIAFESLHILRSRWKDGTFGEILDDWKWILGYSARYKLAIAFYVFLGIFSTTLGLAGSVASKYTIDIITGYQTEKLWLTYNTIIINAVKTISVACHVITS